MSLCHHPPQPQWGYRAPWASDTPTRDRIIPTPTGGPPTLFSVLAAPPQSGSSSAPPPLLAEAPVPSGPLTASLACRALELSLELSRVSLERDSLSRELFRTIRQKVALTQELEAWQVRGGAWRRGARGGAGSLTGSSHPAALPAGRHAGGHRPAAALATPERTERRRMWPAPRRAALLPAPGPWARRRLPEQPLPKDLTAGPRGQRVPAGSLSSSGQCSNRAPIVFQTGLVASPLREAGQSHTGSRGQLWGSGAPGGWRRRWGRAESCIYTGLLFSKHSGPGMFQGRDGGGYLCIEIKQSNI